MLPLMILAALLGCSDPSGAPAACRTTFASGPESPLPATSPTSPALATALPGSERTSPPLPSFYQAALPRDLSSLGHFDRAAAAHLPPRVELRWTVESALFEERKPFDVSEFALRLRTPSRHASYAWSSAVGQVLFLGMIQHSFRVVTEGKTRRELGGPFVDDWMNSARSLVDAGWSDGGRDFTNYVTHPAAGSVYGYIYRQNHPVKNRIRFAANRQYAAHLAKSAAFSFVAGLNFELGPMSEASVGNVGLYDGPQERKMAWTDIIVTPAVGVGVVTVMEDALDRFVVERLEGNISSPVWRFFLRVGLNPTRALANVVTLKNPGHRSNR